MSIDKALREQEVNKITKMISLGGGDASRIACDYLHQRLDEALMTLSGMQQNGSMGTKFDEEADHKGQNKVKEIIKEITVALTGKGTL